MVKGYRYKARFENIVTASADFDSNILLSQASLSSLKSLIPDSVNLEENIDLIGGAFNAAVVNQFNRNGDGIDTNSAIGLKDFFVHKPTNIEHNKRKIVGHIVNAGFSSYGENKIITPDQVRGQLDPFNIALASVVYKTVDKKFASALLESNDPDSPLYQKISASWEIGFTNYIIAIGSKNLKDAEVVTDEAQIKELKKYLKRFDGEGVMDDGTPIYNLITGRIYPLGIGFTTNPAANVESIIIQDNEYEDDDEEENETSEADSIYINSLDLFKNNKNFSHNTKTPVNKTKTNIMDLEQILQELKTVLASKQGTEAFSDEAVANISEKIATSIKDHSDEIQAKIVAAEEAKAQAVSEAAQFKKDLEQNSLKLDEALAKIEELESTLSAQAAQELFNSRMSILDEGFDLENEDRELLAKDIRALDSSDEAWASFQEKINVIYRHKSKAYKDEQEKIFQEKLEEELAKRIQEKELAVANASANGDKDKEDKADEKEVEVETALANADQQDAGNIPAQNAEPTNTEDSWKTKISKAFSKENITVNY